MISAKMADAINKQINRELFSAYLYLAMSNDATEKGFKGAASWFMLQFHEEQEHALKFSKYLQDQNAKVELFAIEEPRKTWADLLEMFKETLAHEQHVTACINELANQATVEKDHATQSMLRWFIDEQVEEESSVNDVIWMLEMSAGSKGAIFMADRQLGKRAAD
jgi:ferritin